MKKSRRRSEAEVAEYWLTHDSTREIRVLAKDRDVPYQSLMKVLLAEKVTELRRRVG